MPARANQHYLELRFGGKVSHCM